MEGNVFELQEIPFVMHSKWFSGKANCLTYSLDELMGTKLRALYQRKKGRDLFDLYWVLENLDQLSVPNMIKAFAHYTNQAGLKISRAEFEKNIYEKKSKSYFGQDIFPLLSPRYRDTFELEKALKVVESKIIVKLSGKPWVKPK